MKHFARSVFLSLLCGLFFCAPSYAQKTKAQLATEITTTFPDNTAGSITALGVRTYESDLINSIMPTAPVVSGNLACFSGTTGLLQDCGAAPSTVALVVGTTPITGGTTTRVLFDNTGIVGEYAISGTGSVCMTTSCTMTAPALGTPASGVATNLTGLPVSTGLTGAGTGVLTALGINVGTAGSPVINGGALGTPSSGTLTSATGLPLSTGVTGAGTGVLTALGINVGTAGSPVINGGALGTPSSGTLTSATGLPISSGVSGLGTGVATALGVNTNSAGGFPTYTATTWTPVITTSATVGTPAYSIQVGTYEQIGRQITARFTIVLSGWTGSPTGNVGVSGLPVTSANVANDNGVCHISNYTVTGLAVSNVGLTGGILPNAALINLYQQSNTGVSLVTAAQMGTTLQLIGVCSYHN